MLDDAPAKREDAAATVPVGKGGNVRGDVDLFRRRNRGVHGRREKGMRQLSASLQYGHGLGHDLAGVIAGVGQPRQCDAALGGEPPTVETQRFSWSFANHALKPKSENPSVPKPEDVANENEPIQRCTARLRGNRSVDALGRQERCLKAGYDEGIITRLDSNSNYGRVAILSSVWQVIFKINSRGGFRAAKLPQPS